MKRIRRELAYFRALLSDSRVPWFARFCLWLGIGYLLLPIDIIPDCIPVLGHVDDLVIVPMLITLGLVLTPKKVREEIRGRIMSGNED